MKELDRLIEIVARLRDPENGCPWDLKQTPASMIPNFIEELYEVVEAIEHHDTVHLQEELGDLMLHIVMQAQMAREDGLFELSDSLRAINEKLILRHPHIFGDGHAVDAEGVKMNWERIKMEEKRHTRESVLDGVPHAMPALIVAHRVQEKAASVGFDWPDHKPIFEKMREETAELEEAIQNQNIAEVQDEIGDILFTVVNLARKLGVDSESAIRGTIAKFEKRFRGIETRYRHAGRKLKESTLEEMDATWDEIKKEEKKQ